ncbi:molybdopterin biosynthesis protein [Rubeoparvulum massiliense]|uniref:molybdopterin biosynthesis protein n=1 Tax=Rubeoparvulum massiliense TaxID=1631346 RepID=UPI00065E21AF|nr:molybdopterin biosynthesis protein [Rubeoparvulum massiliense]
MKTGDFQRQIYLEDKPRIVARDELLNAWNLKRETEWLPTKQALGRITASPIFAELSAPHYHASAMDGIAVRAETTYGAHEMNPLTLKKGRDFIFVDTGDPIPAPLDAVIMIEKIHQLDDDTVEIIEPITPWQDIRPIGEDMVHGEMILPQGHRLRPVDLGALLAGGILQVPVVQRPRVAILPTGSELVQPTTEVHPGDIIEFNGTVFASYVEEWGGDPFLQPITKDDPDLLRRTLREQVQAADLVIVNAGSSAGSEDYTVHILNELGEVFTHGVATRPGKPVILGMIDGKPVIGLPGYPVSAYLAMEWFVRPLICHYLGIPEPQRSTLKARLGRRVVSNMGAEDFVRVNVGQVDGQYIALPLTRAAGVTMSMVRADGLLVVPPDSLGLEQGEEVEIQLYQSQAAIDKSILFSGSHDLTIDLLSSHMRTRDVERQIIAAHTGSMAGILAIRKGEAHLAGIHLLDTETGEYNRSFVQRFATGKAVVLLPFLKRAQGWFVPKGNPDGIHEVSDLVKKEIQFVNRQKGAGTRVLFDHLLRKAGISPEQIEGYNREMFTHLSVAAEVKERPHSVGLGIYSAAKAMGLDFIYLADESYDLLMTQEFFESAGGRLLYKVISSPQFVEEVNRLGGYKVVDHPEPIYFDDATTTTTTSRD